MTVQTIQTVNIDFAKKAKYIVATLGDGRLVVWSGVKYGYHKEILAALKCSASNDNNITILGGGWIGVDTDSKKIALWGFSVAYDQEPDRKATAALIKQHHPDYSVTY